MHFRHFYLILLSFVCRNCAPKVPPNFPQGDDFPFQDAAFRFELNEGILHDGIPSRMVRQHLQFIVPSDL